MTPRQGVTNELKRFLLSSKESAVKAWHSDLVSKPGLRKRLSSQIPPDKQADTLSDIYDSLIDPLSLPTKTGKTRKVRLGKPHRKCTEAFPLNEVQQAQLMLLETLIALVRKRYSAKPKKCEKLSSLLSHRMHDLVLQASEAAARRQQQARARVEGKYATLLNIASDAIFLLDFESGLFVDVNKAACELTGHSESELKKMGFNSLVSVFDLNLALDRASTAILKGAVRFDDLSIITRKGSSVPVDISATAVTIDGSRYILGIMRDIKERKAFEKNIQEKAERLRLVNEIAQTISSAELDIQTVLTTVLEAMARVIKVEAGSILRVDDGKLLFMVALGEKADFVKPFRLKMGQGIAGWVAETGEGVIVRNPQKDPRYYSEVEKASGFKSKSILAVPMKTGDTVVGVIELINKIGGRFTKKDLDLIQAIASFAAVALEHARLYSQCEVSKARLAQVHSPVSSSRLAAVVAHEMKDPLGIVKNYVHILSAKLSSTGTDHDELAVISDEVNRIVRITDQLLNFAEAYSEPPKNTPLNLLIQNSIESMQEGLENCGIATELKLDTSIPEISVIPNQMKMIFSSLIRFAMADMPDGGTLSVATRRDNSDICVEFATTGVAHTSEEASELFLPSAVAKGIVPKGLGLYMAYNIIRNYGGDIEVKASRGKNIFKIMIPKNTGHLSGGAAE